MDNKEELKLDQKVTVRSIAGWNVGFARIEGFGDLTIAPFGTTRLSRSEIIAQVQNGNRLFTGTDGFGSHPTLIIEDTPTRVELDFESEDGSKKQLVFSDEKMKSLFALKTLNAFKKNFQEAVYTRAEKYAAITAIQRLKLNDYDKIRFVEDYTGYKLS